MNGHQLIGILGLLMTSGNAVAEIEAPPSGLSVDRGSFEFEGRSLAWFCIGQGEPTLILEAPSGLSNEEAYGAVVPALAEQNRVCAYERAHYGDSDPLPPGQIQSVRDYALELQAFLGLESMREPFVLVGYSYGGWVSRYFTASHPESVAGLVLIDSPHVDWIRGMREQMSAEDWAKMQEILDWFLSHRGHDPWSSQFEMEQAAPLPSQLPVLVITRGLDHQGIRPAELSEQGFRIYNDLHFELAPELLELTAATRGIIAEQSQHLIPESEPVLVIEAIRGLLARL